MGNPTLLRKARFKAALTVADLRLYQWAEEHGVTYRHLHEVLAGRRESQRLTSQIDQFIRQHRVERVA